jgi:hypothetical protein
MCYGKFNVSWTGNGATDSRRRLNDWLDPNNTNTTLDGGYYQCNTIYINNQTYSSGTQTVTGCIIEISNTTINSGATVNINSQQGVSFKPDFWAKNGSNVTVTALHPSLSSSASLVRAYIVDTDMLTSLERAVALPQVGDIDFTIYPNPNDGHFTVKIAGDIQPYTMEIFNVSGSMLGQVECNAEAVNISRSDLPSGIYYLKLSMGSNKTAVKKVIVK